MWSWRGGVCVIVEKSEGGGGPRPAAGIHHRAAEAATRALRIARRNCKRENQQENNCRENVAETRRTPLPELCLKLHELTPVPRRFSGVPILRGCCAPQTLL